MQPGVNLEFARSGNLDLDQALRAAAEASYEYAEPYVPFQVEPKERPDGHVIWRDFDIPVFRRLLLNAIRWAGKPPGEPP